MSDSENLIQRRGIRSYVIREGRMTPGQQQAYEQLWPRYGMTPDQLASSSLLTEKNPVVLEIGFGMGDSLFEQARDNQHEHFVGVEMHRPGIGHLMQLAAAQDLTNLTLIRADAVILLSVLPALSLSRIQIFFPDPWHKKRHHKRRLVNSELLDLMSTKLNPEGLIHLATDWENYAQWMMEVFSQHPAYQPAEALSRPETKYERRGKRLGHEVTDLVYRLAP